MEGRRRKESSGRRSSEREEEICERKEERGASDIYPSYSSSPSISLAFCSFDSSGLTILIQKSPVVVVPDIL